MGHSGSLLPWSDPALPGMPNSKINLPNINPKSLVAFSNLLKPRFGQKSKDATTIAPKTPDLKTRQEEKRNGGNTGIHGKRTRWGSTPPKEMERNGPETEGRRSPPAARWRWRERKRNEGTKQMDMGGGNHPCPRLNPLAPPLSGSTVVMGGSTAPSQR